MRYGSLRRIRTKLWYSPSANQRQIPCSDPQLFGMNMYSQLWLAIAVSVLLGLVIGKSTIIIMQPEDKVRNLCGSLWSFFIDYYIQLSSESESIIFRIF